MQKSISLIKKNITAFTLIITAFFSTCLLVPLQFLTAEEISLSKKDFQISNLFNTNMVLFDEKRVNFAKGWIGIFMENRVEGGILVKMTIKGSPAHLSGMKSGDIITKINNTLIEGEGDAKLKLFKKIVEESGKSSVVTITLVRDGAEMEIKTRLISKLLDNEKNKDAKNIGNTSNYFIDKLKNRETNSKGALLKFAFKNDDFKEKSSDTLQRLGEEIFAREGYQYTSNRNLFRLPLIDYLMSHPFDVPYTSDILYNEFIDEEPLNSVISAINLLGLKTEYTVNISDSGKNRNLQNIIENIINNMFKSINLRNDALANIKAEELQYLYDNATELWLDSRTDDEVSTTLETCLKVDMQLLIKSLLSVIESIPFKELTEIDPLHCELHPFTLPDTAKNNDNQVKTSFAGDVLFTQNTDIGKIVVGGTGTTYYYDDAAFILDLGGDDYYFNNAGGSNNNETPISVCIDLSGDDSYNSKQNFAQGSGNLGIGLLWDVKGNDRYIATDFSQGFGLFGIGMLIDNSGDDLYNAQSMSQGGGAFGVGMLHDKNGNDRYLSSSLSQGVGFTKGVGGLFDLVGNDSYFAGNTFPDFRAPDRSFQSLAQGFGMGIRPIDSIAGASGGIGLLFDANGNDLYHGDYFAQGSSYYFSLGVLYDKKGHDRYYAGRYSQGAGIHSTIGILKDDEGNDTFDAYFGVSQACGYDTGIGYLINTQGDDFYRSNVMSQGTGGEKGLGVLADLAGDDHYHSGNDSMGYSYESKNETFYGIGILADIGGSNDMFNREIGTDTVLYQNNAGILINKGN